MILKLYRCFLSEIARTGGFDAIIPIHATVSRLGFSNEPDATNAAGTGKRISAGPSFLFMTSYCATPGITERQEPFLGNPVHALVMSFLSLSLFISSILPSSTVAWSCQSHY
jgi:hypothetical protein